MDYTQNAKIAQVTEKSLVIGVDVGSGTHYARAFNWRGQELSKKAFSFENDLGGYRNADEHSGASHRHVEKCADRGRQSAGGTKRLPCAGRRS